MKDCLLKLCKPAYIHRETFSTTRKVFDYEPEWQETLKNETIIRRGGFYEKVEDDDYDYYENNGNYYGDKRYVEFVVIPGEPSYRYYLFYDFGNHSFHTPIVDPERYELPIVDVGELHTYGHEIDDLILMDFVKKVIHLVESKNYTLVEV